MPHRYHPRHARPRKLRRFILAAVLLLLAAFFALPLIEPRWYQVEETRIEMPQLSGDVKRLRIVYISDIHESGGLFFSHEDTRGLVSRINALNPDIVLLGGDYASSPEDTEAFFRDLPAFKTNYGVYAVLGEHDRAEASAAVSERSLEELRRITRNKEITLLVNEAAAVRVGMQTLYICGLDDAQNGRPDAAAVAAKVTQDDLVILLAHNPSLIESAQEATDRRGKRGWFDLGFFGHTHGGQIALLGGALGFYEGVPAGHRGGWFTENRVPMLVSNGIGTTRLPMRFLRRPQIHLITLVSGK